MKVRSITEVDSKMGEFDTILMMGNNFGLFGSPRRARQLLKRFHDMTSPSARIIAESLDIYKHPLDPLRRQYQCWNRSRGRISGQVSIRMRYRRFATPWFDYLLVSRPEMRGILQTTGWKMNRFITSRTGPAYVEIIEKEKK